MAQSENEVDVDSDETQNLESDNEFTELLLSVRINQQDMQHVTLFLQDEDDNIYINEADLQRYGIRPPPSYPVYYQSQVFYSASDFADYAHNLDLQHLTIDFDIPLEFYETRTIHADTTEFVEATPSDFGAFFNYDLLVQESTEPSSTELGGILTPGIFSQYGLISSTFLAQDNLTNGNDETAENSLIRLNSTWRIDYPETMRTLQLGDSFSKPGLWGNSVDFGGIQWGTNFSTQPTFLTFPLPSASGEAVVPSVIDLYLNNALLDSEAVPPGPFTIDEIPVITGEGEILVVTTDLLGRQHVVSIPYYASEQLLKPGLHDYSIDVGFIRENFGIESNDYGQLMGAVTDRYGMTDYFTSEWRIEAADDQQAAGFGGDFLIDEYAVASIAMAGSHNSTIGEGGLLEAGFSHRAMEGITYGLNVITTTHNFTQIGFGEDTRAPSYQAQYFTGMALPVGTLAATYVQQNNRSSEHLGFATVTFYSEMFYDWTLNVTALSHVKGPDNHGVFITFSRLFGQRTTANVGANLQQDSNQGFAQLTQALPLDDGWGYNLYASPGENATYIGSVSAQNDYGTYSVGAAQQNDVMGYDAQAAGAVVLIDNDLYLSRYLGSSFGVVQIPGQENVRVYNYNQVVGTTDDEGKVFMPVLLPYQNNAVGIETDDLPIGTEVQTDQINVIPYYGSGIFVEFPIQSNYGALVQVVDVSGQPLAAGVAVEAMDHENPMMIADNGETYLTQLKEGVNTFKALVNSGTCVFTINYQHNDEEPVPHLGTATCEE